MFWTLNGKKIKNSLLILVTAFFAALVAFIQSEEVRVFSTEDGPAVLSKVETDKKQIALTFDIGWGDVRVKPILKYLKKENVNATFFLSGLWAERHSEIVEKMDRKGIEIASHGMKHQAYTGMESSEIRRDMIQAQEMIEKLTGETPKFIRPPKGKINDDIVSTASRLKLDVVLWSVNPQDIRSPGYKKIASRTIEHSDKGDIILLHASDSAKQTLQALPRIIKELKDNGFKFVTLSELVANADVKSKEIK